VVDHLATLWSARLKEPISVKSHASLGRWTLSGSSCQDQCVVHASTGTAQVSGVFSTTPAYRALADQSASYLHTLWKQSL
jgi:hypothetical protein